VNPDHLPVSIIFGSISSLSEDRFSGGCFSPLPQLTQYWWDASQMKPQLGHVQLSLGSPVISGPSGGAVVLGTWSDKVGISGGGIGGEELEEEGGGCIS